MIRIAIVEDNNNYLESLKTIILHSDDMKFVGSHNSAEGFEYSLKQSKSLNIQILILDLHLPGRNGLTLIPMVKEKFPKTEVLVITQRNDHLTTLEAIRLGASGYILKNSPIAEIRRAIRDVAEGGCVIDPQLSKLVLKSLTPANAGDETAGLSKREVEVLELMAVGYAKKEVADELDISYGTVAQATHSIYRKLQVPNITAAVSLCIRKGVI